MPKKRRKGFMNYPICMTCCVLGDPVMNKTDPVFLRASILDREILTINKLKQMKNISEE